MNVSSINTPIQYNKYNKNNKINTKQENINFNGKLGDSIGKAFSKHYVEPMLNNKTLHKTSEKLSSRFSNITAHMATLGSLITSGVYMERTLSNKNLDPDKRKTLSINQGLCFVIPTALAYFVDSKLGNYIKNKEHKYSNIQSCKKARGEMTSKQVAEYEKLIGPRLKGFKTLATLATFTLIYRYLTPVAITPVANWIGKKLNNHDQAKQNETQETKKTA